jgi:hypothetical protein
MRLRSLLPFALAAFSACLNLPIPRAVPADADGLGKAPRESMTSPRKAGESPFAGASFMVDPDSNAGRQVERWKDSRPADAALLKKIADQPTAA